MAVKSRRRGHRLHTNAACHFTASRSLVVSFCNRDAASRLCFFGCARSSHSWSPRTWLPSSNGLTGRELDPKGSSSADKPSRDVVGLYTQQPGCPSLRHPLIPPPHQALRPPQPTLGSYLCLMSHNPGNPHVPQARQGDDLGPWPVGPQRDSDYDLYLMDTFVGRVEYCRRLAARQASLPELGIGWSAIIVARLSPIFSLGQFSSRSRRKCLIDFVLQQLQELREELTHAGDPWPEYSQTSWVAQILVSGRARYGVNDHHNDHTCVGCHSSTIMYAHCKLLR